MTRRQRYRALVSRRDEIIHAAATILREDGPAALTSVAHTEDDITETADALRTSLRMLKDEGAI